MINKRRLLSLGIAVAALLSSTCGPSATPTAGPSTPTVVLSTATPTVNPNAPMFGVWRGITSQEGGEEGEIAFLIPGDRSRVCVFSLSCSTSCGWFCGWSSDDMDCDIEDPYISPEGHFAYENQSTAMGISFTERIEGDFDSATTANGTFRHEEGSCIVSGTWSASLTDSPTPTPRVCPTIRPGKWSGAATFTVPEDRSRVLDFNIQLSYGPPIGTIEFAAPELPITDCVIQFSGSSNGTTFEGRGVFTSETELNGSHSAGYISPTGAGAGSGTWISRWESGDE